MVRGAAVSRGTDEGRAESQRRRQARAEAAGFDNYGKQYRARADRAARATTRKGTRVAGTNPRRQATNPSAGTPPDIARVHRETRRAYARLHARDEHWCDRCNDTGHVYLAEHPEAERETWIAYPCPDHRQMTTADADLILRPDD